MSLFIPFYSQKNRSDSSASVPSVKIDRILEENMSWQPVSRFFLLLLLLHKFQFSNIRARIIIFQLVNYNNHLYGWAACSKFTVKRIHHKLVHSFARARAHTNAHFSLTHKCQLHIRIVGWISINIAARFLLHRCTAIALHIFSSIVCVLFWLSVLCVSTAVAV